MPLRLDAFDNSYFAKNTNVQAIISTSYGAVFTLTATPQTVDHAIIADLDLGPKCCRARRTLSEVIKESQSTAGYHCLGVISDPNVWK